jgi:hypothetical protein
MAEQRNEFTAVGPAGLSIVRRHACPALPAVHLERKKKKQSENCPMRCTIDGGLDAKTKFCGTDGGTSQTKSPGGCRFRPTLNS